MKFLQGRTIPKVITSLSEHPFSFTRLTWEGLYVALSRVRQKDDIRLLLRFEDETTLEYIGGLRKNKFVKSFFSGYEAVRDHAGHQQNNIDSDLLMRWNAKLASFNAGFIQISNT